MHQLLQHGRELKVSETHSRQPAAGCSATRLFTNNRLPISWIDFTVNISKCKLMTFQFTGWLAGWLAGLLKRALATLLLLALQPKVASSSSRLLTVDLQMAQPDEPQPPALVQQATPQTGSGRPRKTRGYF